MQAQYALIGYLGYKIGALAGLPDAAQLEEISSTDTASTKLEEAHPSSPEHSQTIVMVESETKQLKSEIVSTVGSDSAEITEINKDRSAESREPEGSRSCSVDSAGMLATAEPEVDREETKTKLRAAVRSEINEIASVSVKESMLPTEAQSSSLEHQEAAVNTAKEAQSSAIVQEPTTIAPEETQSPSTMHQEPTMITAEEVSDRKNEGRFEKLAANVDPVPVLVEDPGTDAVDVSNEESATPVRRESYSADDRARKAEATFQCGWELERTHRQELRASDELWTPWRKQRARRPKTTRNPFFAYRSSAWWEVRAEMPHLQNKFEIMQEVSRRWREMPQQTKDALKISMTMKNSRTARARSEGADTTDNRMRHAVERLSSIRQQRSNGQSTSGIVGE